MTGLYQSNGPDMPCRISFIAALRHMSPGGVRLEFDAISSARLDCLVSSGGSRIGTGNCDSRARLPSGQKTTKDNLGRVILPRHLRF